MSYSYAAFNRLEEPHNYMYAPFQGVALLEAYLTNRRQSLNRTFSKADTAETDQALLTAATAVLEELGTGAGGESLASAHIFLPKRPAAPQPAQPVTDTLVQLTRVFERLSTFDTLATVELVRALVARQLVNSERAQVGFWLDRLVQRFEVTKKLYDRYPPGFRKGEGETTTVRLYWLFALALCLSCVDGGRLKYLSTLLKVNDLLCSLPDNLLDGAIPEGGLALVIFAEVAGVMSVAESQGLTIVDA